MKSFLCVLLTPIALTSFGQIMFIDKDNKPISFVHVILNKSYFITQTDLNGQLHWNVVQHLKSSDTLLFRHVSYEPLFIAFPELSNRDTIALKERAHIVNEVNITSGRNKSPYQLTSACYRSYQTNNDTISHYTDGKVEYLSKRNKDRFDLHRKSYRSLVNNELEKGKAKRKTELQLEPGVPYPPAECVPDVFTKRHNLHYMTNPCDSNQTWIYNKSGTMVGNIEQNTHYIKYNIIDESFVGMNHLANTEIERVRKEVFMVFKNEDSLDVKHLNSLERLVYAKILLEYRIKHNKDDDYARIFRVDELFIENVSFVDSFEKGKFNDGYGMPKSSNYTDPFWETCDCRLYQPAIEKFNVSLKER
jgi:hypothetical protein